MRDDRIVTRKIIKIVVAGSGKTHTKIMLEITMNGSEIKNENKIFDIHNFPNEMGSDLSKRNFLPSIEIELALGGIMPTTMLAEKT